jgi:hypothetical protein
VALGVALAASAAALALSIGGPSGLFGPFGLVVGALLLVPFVEVSVPKRLVQVLPRLAALVLLVAGLLAWFSRSLGTLVLEPSMLTLVAGPLVLAIAVVFALAPLEFSVGRALAPAILGVLCVAGLDPSPEGYRATSLPFLRGSEHTGFAERYIALALVAMLALWTSALLERGPRWRWRTAATLAVSVLLAVALATTGVIGLPMLQPRIEKAVASTFADGTTGLSEGSTLGEFAELAVSRRRVLDLQTSVEGGAWRLPSQVFTQFDGHRWSDPAAVAAAPSSVIRPASTSSRSSPLLDGIGSWFDIDRGTASGRTRGTADDVVSMRITQAAVDDWPLFVPRGTGAVTAAAWLLEMHAYGLLRRPRGHSLSLYGAQWSPPSSSGGPLAADERAAALALPPVVDPRFRSLADTLAAAATDPEARIEATVRHLQNGYRYTLAPGAFRTGDPLAEFLFEKKAGYCEYFASAAVVLLRLQGVPARYVKGLAVGPHTDQGGGLHVVRESDAHAWIEAFVPGRGWIEADPTPPGQFQASRPRASVMSRLAARVRAALSSAWTRLVARGPTAFVRWLASQVGVGLERLVRSPVFWLVIASGVFSPWLLRLIRAARLRPAPPPRDAADTAVPDDLRDLVRELERRWSAAGVARPPGRGLLEHAQKLAAADANFAPPPLRDAALRIVSAYYRARFGGDMPGPADLADLRRTASRS